MYSEQKINPYSQMLYFIFHDLLQAMRQAPELRSGFHKTLLSNIL